jgi:UDP-3-O-[3-hydroxymyristoyl] N-acetylglucosamine deacetylase
MLDKNQKTLIKSASFEGVGLHSGVKVKVNLVPAKDNTGILFKRVDLKDNNIIKANYKAVSSAKLCTTLENENKTKVSTVEHLMAAFYITGIDNIIVEIDNSEVPIMDGSSKEFIELIEKTGIKSQLSPRHYLKILKKVELNQDGKTISIKPNEENFNVDFQLEYKNKIIGNQRSVVNFSHENLETVYSSRTFCLYDDIEKIRSQGLAKGGSLSNAVVVRDDEILNTEGLRNKNEFVNHKILDLAGDFLLSGYRVLGDVKCVQGGHQLSNNFLKEVLKDRKNFEITTKEIKLNTETYKTSVNKVAVNA